MNTPSYFQYWAKAHKAEDGKELQYHLLPYHLLDVAAVSYTLLEQDTRLRNKLASLCGMNEDVFQLWITFMLGLHDIGKFSHTFQNLRNDISKLNDLPETDLDGTKLTEDYRVRHDALGYVLYEHQIKPYCNKRVAPDYLPILFMRLVDTLSHAIMGHHGKPIDLNKMKSEDVFKTRFWSTTSEHISEYISDWSKLAGIWDNTSPYFKATPERYKKWGISSWDIAGFVVLCDWIGSSNFFTYKHEAMSLEDYWNDIALKNAVVALKEFGMLPISNPITYQFSCSELFGFNTPSPLQKLAEEYRPQSQEPELVIIEDVTGAGKTEAALIIANRLMANGNVDGVFFALPTMATANAMYKRIEKSYRKFFSEKSNPTLVLAHGASKLNSSFKTVVDASKKKNLNDNDYTEDEQSITSLCTEWLANSNRKAFLADVGVGTIDQALSSVLTTKFQALRLIGMTRKVLIVDEVHANDSYMHRVLEHVLEAQAALGGCVVLLSATLPQSMRSELIAAFRQGLSFRNSTTLIESKLSSHDNSPYPLVTICNSEQQHPIEIPCASRPDVSRTVDISLVHDKEDVLLIIKEAISQGKCVCWVRNTVQDTREAYNDLLSAVEVDNITLFHARFAMCDRLNIETEILNNFGSKSSAKDRRGKLVIATQVVEQSLDVDFDILISDLSPMDSLIQRFGRAMRHNRDIMGNRLNSGEIDQRGKPHVYVFAPRLDVEIHHNWYSSFLKRSAKVYPNHATLWRTAKWFDVHKKLVMPNDARNAIETVYSSTLDDVPVVLHESWSKQYGENQGVKSIAEWATIDFEIGYRSSEATWQNDVNPRTRL
ncbi:MAG: CRISPR-associated helicase Cas3', partial [Candidatus Kapabacteria bacterium]|nr:CRISPR-associated helicase Cas3' [Candidatus Kapabacteria bacterium]